MGGCASTEGGGVGATAENKPQKRPVPDPNTCTTKDNYAGCLAAPRDVEEFRQFSGDDVHVFTYREMRIATNNFRPDQILGEGGFGFVYKGLIDENVRPGLEPMQVAVKELNPEGVQGDREWLAEVNYLVQLTHPHLVKLVGYCCEDDHRLLVYEYMAGGSLEKHIFRPPRISVVREDPRPYRVIQVLTPQLAGASSAIPWSVRMKIALGAAKGLAFLHGAERPIIYRDFKTSNILLDKDYNAKLSDFGLAKDGPMGDQTHVSTRVLGTYGYAAPEYVMTGHLTARSDVYGFGVVLLEMLIGRKALDKSRPSREHNLVEWARPLLNHNRKLLRIIDQRMEGQYTPKCAQKAANLAYVCLSQHPRGRPTMQEAVEILEALQEPTSAFVHRGIAKVTLNEATKDSSPNTFVAKRHSNRPKGERGGEVCRRRRPQPLTEHRASAIVEKGVRSKHYFDEFPSVDQHGQSDECDLRQESFPAKKPYME